MDIFSKRNRTRTNEDAKEFVRETVQFFRKYPKRWSCGDWGMCTKNQDRMKESCLVAQMAVDLGLPPAIVADAARYYQKDFVTEYVAHKLGVGYYWVKGLISVNDNSSTLKELEQNVEKYLKTKKTPSGNINDVMPSPYF